MRPVRAAAFFYKRGIMILKSYKKKKILFHTFDRKWIDKYAYRWDNKGGGDKTYDQSESLPAGSRFDADLSGRKRGRYCKYRENV